MRINPKNIDGIYDPSSNISETSRSKRTQKEVNIQRDRVDISKNSLNRDELEDIKTAALNQTEKGTEPDKLRRLKAQIGNGTYFVSSNDIAGAMLKTNQDEK